MEKTMISVKKLTKNAILPKRAHKTDAGFDLYSVEDKGVWVGERELIKTGIAIALPSGYEAQIRPRSGMAIKHGITVLNTPGTIDEEYRGEIGIILINHGDDDYIVKCGDKIAQIVFKKVENVDIIECENLDDTDRGDRGFGSTGQ